MHSPYIIDGVQMDYTPAQMLDDCMPQKRKNGTGAAIFDSIVDEITDHVLKKTVYDPAMIPVYTEQILKTGRTSVRDAALYPKSSVRRRIAAALLSSVWKKGHFTLEDLKMRAEWKWDCAPLGNMAAFYFSVESAGTYLFDLGIRLEDYTFEKADGISEVSFSVSAESGKNTPGDSEYDFFNEKEPDEMRYCWMSEEPKCGNFLVKDENSWLIYIPFDTCDFRLGGSLLEKAAGPSGETAPEIQDPDYFIDCFEVVRELVEDGVIISGASTCEGGIAVAAASMCGEAGICIDTSGIERASGENDIIRILFSEIPGVIVQIRDSDYDYIDSQLLLQDIAYFPLGHPDCSSAGFSAVHGHRPGVSDILAALIQGHYSEGED